MDTVTSAIDNFSVWEVIMQYLPPEDVAKLQSLCKTFNENIESERLEGLWQPYLNQLHAIDDSISVKPKAGQSIKDAFVKGLLKMRADLLKEMTALSIYNWDLIGSRELENNCFDGYSHIAEAIMNPARISHFTLKDIILLNADLDAYNSKIIELEIEKSKANNPLYFFPLRARCIITRLPKSIIENPQHQSFWLNLKTLRLVNHPLQELPNNIDKLQALEELEISCTKFNFFSLPVSIFSAPPELRNLDPYSTGVTRLPETIVNMAKLKLLNISGNRISKLPESIYHLQQLRTLSICDNYLIKLPENIGMMQRLEILNASHNKLTVLPKSISHLQQLVELNISYNEFTSMPKSISHLLQLTSLNMSRNKLTTLRESIGYIRRLVILNVADNQLTSIPGSIGTLQHLQELYVSYNNLTTLPECIGDMRLRRLYAQCNQFTSLPYNLKRSFYDDPITHLEIAYNITKSKVNQLTAAIEPFVQAADNFIDMMHGDVVDEALERNQDILDPMDIDELGSKALQKFSNGVNWLFRKNGNNHNHVVIEPVVDTQEERNNKRQSDSPESGSKRLKR